MSSTTPTTPAEPFASAPNMSSALSISTAQPIITASHLAKNYGEASVLADINLQVFAGEFLAIIGPSGSGKSTLLQILGCIDHLDSGELTIFGQNAAHLTDHQAANLRSTTFGFVFQFFNTEPHLSIAKNLEIPLMLDKVNSKERQARVENAANLVGITKYLKRKPAQLSGGELQRAAIARAIINRPKVILADEPTGHLDRLNKDNIVQLFQQIKQDQNVAIVMVTHDLTIASQADRALSLEDGKLVPVNFAESTSNQSSLLVKPPQGQSSNTAYSSEVPTNA